jgi:hypothetical protein
VALLRIDLERGDVLAESLVGRHQRGELLGRRLVRREQRRGLLCKRRPTVWLSVAVSCRTVLLNAATVASSALALACSAAACWLLCDSAVWTEPLWFAAAATFDSRAVRPLVTLVSWTAVARPQPRT